jgi:hypothetical protein
MNAYPAGWVKALEAQSINLAIGLIAGICAIPPCQCEMEHLPGAI